MSASNTQSLFSPADWRLGLAYGERSTPLQCDPNIDDPVNDTGCGPRRGDLQLSEELACLLRVLVGDGEEFS